VKAYAAQVISFLRVLRTRWRLLAVTSLVGAMAGLVVFAVTPSLFTATVTTIAVATGEDQSVEGAVEGDHEVQDWVRSSAYVVTSDRVISAVKVDLQTPVLSTELAAKISVNHPEGTAILEISATDEDPGVAMSMANSTAEHFAEEITRLESQSGLGGPLMTVRTLNTATPPRSPSSPSAVTYLLLGLLGGLAFGVIAVVAQGLRKVEEDAATPG
jgi:receptor protein-tyrosine kinase